MKGCLRPVYINFLNLKLLGRAGELREHQDSWVFSILRGDVFLGDEVHAVAQRRYQTHPSHAIERGQRCARVGAVDITDRRPGWLAMTAIDLTDKRADRLIQVGVFGYLGARFRRHLEISHLAALFRIGVEEVSEGLDAMGDALRVVKTIDAKDETPAAGLWCK